MSLFQNSVLKKYLRALDKTAVEAAWQRYTTHFFDPQYQHNVRAAKEEQYQEGFLRDLFVNILGYTLHPKPGFNLTTELKNVRGAQKTDGAILKDGHAIAVIELKGTDTINLDKIEAQAFGYKRNQTNCTYVITSNFEKLRFYIDDSIDFIDFPLFQLTKDEFDLLYLCLSIDSLLTDLPKRIKSESLTQEEAITKQLYKDYSAFRREIFDSIVRRNPEHDKLTLFKSTQKLLDRFLFIFFAEDRGLLPPNSIREIINQWTRLRDELDAYTPLYARFKKYFGYLNTGHKGTKHEIFAYNGGLFTTDELLDSILIDDDILYAHTQRLSDYDFESEVSVNILGHIFEHSLNEIEEIQAELEGQELDKSKTKRKKDGVFYTPKYITKYIVDNTVGRLCEEKKAALNIDEAEYEKDRKGRPVQKLKTLQQQLEDYRSWLLELTICDPACGSGAFLNQALEYLIAEHQYVDTLQTKLLGGGFTFPNVENAILEHNLYGVDINDESVEIAKLSLWLRTAQRGRKLTSLNHNIKCGNSLIDDPEVAGEKAFSWHAEFPEVFDQGGFDVVIGNPPYVRQETLGQENKMNLLNKYVEVGNGIADLYVYFYQLGLSILKEHGLLSYITPNKWLKTKYGRELRAFLVNKKIVEIIDFFELKIFQDASTEPLIIIIENCTSNISFDYFPIKELSQFLLRDIAPLTVDKIDLNESEWIIVDGKEKRLLKKLFTNSISLRDISKDGVKLGIKTALNKAFIIDKSTKEELIKKDPSSSVLISNYTNATDIKAWHLENRGENFLINTGYDIEISEHSYRAIWEYLNKFKDDLYKRQDQGKTPYNLRPCDYYDLFTKPKIIFIHTAVSPHFYYDTDGIYVNNNAYLITNADQVVSAILNSKVFGFLKIYLFAAFGDAQKGGRSRLNHEKMSRIPIPREHDEETRSKIISAVTEIKDLSYRFYKSFSELNNLLKHKYNIDSLSKKLESWYELSFGDFLQELKKKKVILTLSEEAEWMPYFEEKKAKVTDLRIQIDRIDAEIDQMVYQLYGLTEDEIAIVEESVG
jgi:type I restriction-modification system DNA methylase subunit